MAKHLIMGTAGHVDHGKTALIRALTGIDCDTHKEEKERGITINLGLHTSNSPKSFLWELWMFPDTRTSSKRWWPAFTALISCFW